MKFKLELSTKVDINDVILNHSDDTYSKSISIGKTASNLMNLKKVFYYLLMNSKHICVDIRTPYATDKNKDLAAKINNYLNSKNITFPIYKPFNSHYYDILELCKKTNILESHFPKISLYGMCNNMLEILWNHNIRKSEITHFASSDIKASPQLKIFQDVISYTRVNYNFNKYDELIISHSDFIYYNYYPLIPTNNLVRLNNIYNIPYLFQGMIECLRNLEPNGTCILYLGSVIYKSSADIFLIMSQYFKSAELYQPEIYSNLKRDGVYCICKEFQGISKKELDELITIKHKIEKIYPNGYEDFNIKDKHLRELLDITKPVDIMPSKYIIGFIDADKTDKIYKDIILFNTRKCINRYIELNNILANISTESENVKLPTKEQIITSMMYCRKWGIEYYDTFDKNIFKTSYAKGILDEIYGLHEPLIYKFKTVNKLYFVKKQSLKLKHGKISTTRLTRKSHSSKTSKSSSKNNVPNIDDNLIRVLETDTFLDSKRLSTRDGVLAFSSRGNHISLLDELLPINNNIDGATKLIDTRRDFSKTTDLQNAMWHKINVVFRNYKHKDNLEREHLDNKVSRILRDYTITQAWLKMYEMIVECGLIKSAGKDGIFRTFHLCELPGGFISACNNYVYSKTKFRRFEWVAQSLNPGNGAKIGNQKGIYKRHKDNWSFGADGTGDITKIRNIKYYKKFTSNVNLITSDCGLDMKTPGLAKVEYCSLVAILYLLPIGGDFVYKVLTPISDGFLLNLIYICYHNFTDLMFFKPVQNAHSREIYLIGKGYRGTDDDIMQKLLYYAEHFDESLDLFGDKYPEEFVIQFMKGYANLADNCIAMYKKHIFYLDHYDELPKEFLELIENYYKEKNMDWIRKYEIKPIEEKLKL